MKIKYQVGDRVLAVNVMTQTPNWFDVINVEGTILTCTNADLHTPDIEYKIKQSQVESRVSKAKARIRF